MNSERSVNPSTGFRSCVFMREAKKLETKSGCSLAATFDEGSFRSTM